MSTYALRGRIVTVNAGFDVIPDGILYVDGKSIVAVQDAAAPPPKAFAGVKPVDTGGTMFPGLIELHNHLAYNIIGLWLVDKKYTNRDQWPGRPSYKTNLTGPIKVLASHPPLLPAITRYVECKSLFGGTTASQGITLSASNGVRKFFKGLVRNVEETFDPDLPDAKAKIGDVASKDANAFRAQLKKAKCYLLHLSEGTDAAAHKHFEALRSVNPEALAPSLSGIHCVALQPLDFKAMHENGGSMVWSPLSNLLLYGQTARVKDAREAGVPVGLGPDWAYSGSKNLLGELKVARAVSAIQNLGISDRELVSMATIEAARILRWDKVAGSLEKGKRADVIVVGGVSADPLEVLFKADESDVRLCVIDGNPRYGIAALMTKLGAEGETINVAGKTRVLSFTNDQDGAPSMKLADARDALADAMKNLPKVAKEVAKPKAMSALALRSTPTWTLALDEIEDTGVEIRPHLLATGMSVQDQPVNPTTLKPVKLDPLTVADDSDFFEIIAKEPNLPEALKSALGAKPAKATKKRKTAVVTT